MLTEKKEVFLSRVKDRLKSKFKVKGLSKRSRRFVRRQVLRGVRFCLKKGIDVTVAERKAFDIGNPFNCILGLNFGSYSTGRRQLGLKTRQAVRLGFAPSKKAIPRWDRVYTEAWKIVGKQLTSLN